MCNDVLSTILDGKIIIIVRGVEGEKLLSLAEALYKGGIRMMEITYTAHDESHDAKTAENIAALARKMEGKMLIGAGTVTRKSQVDLTKAAGGKFIISPDTNPKIISYTKECGLISIPGALTPSEIAEAHRAGADLVKLFPANLFGPSYVKTVLAPLSHVKLLAVGGVDETTIEDYSKAGASGFGIGTKFGNPELLKNSDFDTISEVVKGYVALAKGTNK